MEMKFYQCAHCGQIVAIVKKTGVPVICCGEPMKEIVPGTTDAAVEKHVPVVKEEDNKVLVTCGEVIHPMEEKHYIEFMILETNKDIKIQYLHPGDEPICSFSLKDDEKVVAAYAYCNLHGLWKNNS